MRKWATAGLFTSVLLLCGCGQLVRATSDFAFNEPWKDYQRVEIRVQNGNVELRATDVTDVRVSGRKSVGGLTFAEAEENLNKIVVKAAASSDHPDTLRVDVSFPDELRQKSVGTDLVVQIPQPCAAQVHSSNGKVQVEHLAGPTELDLRSSNGAIHATLPESFAAEYRLAATNGHVSVSLGQATVKSLESSKRRYHAVVNGGGATVIAETSNGSVTVDTR